MNQELRDNIKNIRNEPPSFQVGKNGVSPSVLKELEERFKQKKIIKIKLLKNGPYENRSEAVQKLQQHLPKEVELLEVRGWTVILRKNK